MTEGQKKALGSIVRWALMLLAAPLIAHKIVDPTIAGVAVDEAVPQLLGWAVAIAALGWSQVQKFISTEREKIALNLPSGSTHADVTAVLTGGAK